MPDAPSSVETSSTIMSMSTGRKIRTAAAPLPAAELQLLAYLGAMLAELERMALAADMDSLQDILSCARREVGRTENRLRPSL